MGPTWVLSAQDGSHVGPMNLAIRVATPNRATLVAAVNTGSDPAHIPDTLVGLGIPCD